MKKSNKYSTFNTALRFSRFTFRTMPARMTALVTTSFLLIISNVASTIISAKLFTAVEELNTVRAVTWLGVSLAVLVMNIFLNGYVNTRFPNTINRVAVKLTERIHAKVGRLPAVELEKPDTLDAINKAEEGTGGGVALVLILTLILCGYGPYFVGIAIYLFTLRPILAVMPAVVFIPTFLSLLYRMKQSKQLEDKAAPIRRRYKHYEACMGEREFFKETRLLGAFSFFRRRYHTAVRLLNREIWKKEAKSASVELLLQIVTCAAYGGLLWLLVDSLIRGYIGAGVFAAVFSAIAAMFATMDEMLLMNLANVLETTPLAANLLRLLDADERKGAETPELSHGIEIKDVHFSYPNAQSESIRGVSLSIKAGETLAIVGTNGAGKTTLVKLLTGLFTPSEGVVLLGGADTKNIDPTLLFGKTSAVFQNYGRYKLTLRRNVLLGDFAKARMCGADAVSRDIENALAGGDVDIACGSYPNGLDTMLSKEFDGTDISGGQWQRVAIARGLYRTHDLIVLDEPTAAIDPIEETRVYKRFAEIAKNNTAIIVTHRLGSCRIADRIAVMDNGRVVEIGTHEQLIASKGLYSDMWESQAEWLA